MSFVPLLIPACLPETARSGPVAGAFSSRIWAAEVITIDRLSTGSGYADVRITLESDEAFCEFPFGGWVAS